MNRHDSVTTNEPEPRTQLQNARFTFMGWLVWGVFALAVCVLVLMKADTFVLNSGERFAGRVLSGQGESITVKQTDAPGKPSRTLEHTEIMQHNRFGDRSVTSVYARASRQWWNSGSMYGTGEEGYLYLPHAAVAFTPFAYLPSGFAELLWRLVSIGAYAWGVWRLTQRLFLRDAGLAFLVATMLAIPAAMGSASNGQTNVLMGGAIALGAVSIIEKRWWLACVWMALLVICKPTALAVVGLVGATYFRPMWWRLAIAGVLVGSAMFVHPSPTYVLDQTREFLDKMTHAAAPVKVFEDIRGMCSAWGLTSPENQLTIVRAIAAIAMLGLCVRAKQSLGVMAAGASVLTLGAIYITVFNPRTEGLSYAIIGPMLAVTATRELWERRWFTAIGLILLCLVLQFSRLVTLSEPNTWVRPLGVLIWLGWLIAEIALGKTRWPVAAEAANRNRVDLAKA